MLNLQWLHGSAHWLSINRRVLKATEGHRANAAKVLGISRKNLWEKMKDYGIE